MPLPLENLDDRSYADLLEEARSRIPALAPEWTNHNPSDPGITLLELLAWRTEMLVYRTNQVPVEHLRGFLALLRGPGDAGVPPGAGEPAVRRALDAAVVHLRERFRAVTAHDYEALATGEFNEWLAKQRQAQHTPDPDSLDEWYQLTGLALSEDTLPDNVSPVARARCVPNRDFGAVRLERRSREAPGHVSLVVVPRIDGAAHGGDEASVTDEHPLDRSASVVARALRGWLDERRTLTTQLHVVEPRYVPVRARMLVVLRPDVPLRAAAAREASPDAALRAERKLQQDSWSHLEDLDPRRTLVRAVERYFDPVSGGRDGAGWPFGRSVYLSEIYQLLEDQEIVEYASTLQVCSTDPRARLLWNDHGEAFGMVLGRETGAAALQLLPWVQLAVEDVFVCTSVVPVEVVVALPARPAGATDDEVHEVRAAIRMAVKGAFPPFGAAPASTADGGDAAATWAVPDTVSPAARSTLATALGEIFTGAPRGTQGHGGWLAVTTDDLSAALAGLPPQYAPLQITLNADDARTERDRSGRRTGMRFLPGEAAEVRVVLHFADAPSAPPAGEVDA